jgi:hypothetical protein
MRPQAFCEQKQYCDGDTVTEDKLLLFLVEEVTSRPLRAKSRKVGGDVPQGQTRLSWRSVRAYVTAITDLWREQKALGMNSHTSPRVDNAREYLRSLQRRDARRDREQYADKGRDTLLDGYTEDEFERLCSELWSHGAATESAGSSSVASAASSVECHFRTLVDILLGHYMLTRGGDRRSAEISDLFTFELKGEGPTRCMPLIFTTRAGKQNQHGRLETIGALRHRKPLLCVLSSLAFYLLYRWDLGQEAFPDLSQRSAWYGIRLIKSSTSDPTAEISYNSQRDWVARAYGYARIFSQKKTHLGRSAGAKLAELKGISEDQIRRAGRWNREQMVGCYLNALPRKFMRTMAGHPPQLGCFDIPRAGVAPPAELLSLIWPQLDAWKGRFGPQPGQVNDLAAAGLTDLLFYLREVVLQDSVAMRRQFPSHPVWDHPAFRHPAYAAFAQEVEASLDPEAAPSRLSVLYQAIPLLADQLQALDARSEQRVEELKQSIGQLLALQSTQSLQLQTLTSGNLVFRLEASQMAGALLPSLPPPANGVSSKSTSAQASIAPTPSADSPRECPVPAGPAAPATPDLPLEPAPKHRMCRAVRTVDTLWREWTVGLQGQPSITELDRRWGALWRAGRHSEQQWYSLRLEAIREIRRIAQARRTSEDAAMWQLNHQQQQQRCSLDQFCKQLRAARKRGHCQKAAQTAQTAQAV